MTDEARLHDLLDLVEQARSEGDKETEAKATAAYQRESVPAQSSEDHGLFYKAQKYIGDGSQGLADSVKNWAHQVSFNPIKNANMTLGGIQNVVGGMLQQPINLFSKDASNPAYTIPQSEDGKAVSDIVGAVMKPVGDVVSGVSGGIGKVTGIDPHRIEAGTNTAMLALPFLKGKPAAIPKKPVPTTAELKAAASDAYKRADDAGVIISPESYQKAVTDIRGYAEKAKLNGNLHPDTVSALKTLDESLGKPITLSEADQLRQVVKDAKGSQKAGDRRMATIVLKKFDDYLNNITAEDTIAGNAPEAVEALNTARDIYRRKSNSEMLDQIAKRAGINAGARYTQGGTDLALRNEFKKLALNEKKMRMFSAEERAAIEKVATGGTLENSLRNLGKFDPTKGGVATTLGLAAGGGIGGAFGGPVGAGVGAMMLPPIGFISSRLATHMTRGNANLVRQSLVGRGLPEVKAPISQPAINPISSGLLADEVAPALATTSKLAKLEAEARKRKLFDIEKPTPDQIAAEREWSTRYNAALAEAKSAKP